MADQGSICTYVSEINTEIGVNLKIHSMDNHSKMGDLKQSFIQNKVSGNVLCFNNPVIRDVVCINDNNDILGIGKSRISDGYFEFNLNANTEKVYCVAKDMVFSDTISIDNVQTIINLTNTYDYLLNSVLIIDTEEMQITSVDLGLNQITVNRGFNSTIPASHSGIVKNKEFNYIVFSGQIGT